MIENLYPSGARQWQRLTMLWLMLLSGPVGAQNLATNPGFESGTTAGWFAFGSSTIAAQSSQGHSGNFAALVSNRTATWHGIGRSLQSILAVGETYQISVWVRLSGATSETVQLTLKTDGGGTAVLAANALAPERRTQRAGQHALTN